MFNIPAWFTFAFVTERCIFYTSFLAARTCPREPCRLSIAWSYN